MNIKIKLFISVIIAFLTISSSIIFALSILKQEAINNYLTISKLNAKFFAKSLNQDIHNIEQTIINITSLLDMENIDINKRMIEILKNYPQIGSINILKNQLIIYSTNSLNIGMSISNQNFFPKTIFDDNMLKVSTPWIGKDFISGNDIYNDEDKIEKNKSSFIPISKKIISKKGEFNVIVNLNSDYFINSFITNIDFDDVIFEIVRLDGILLLSTKNIESIGKRISEIDILKETIDNNQFSGIETIDGIKYILTSVLTEDYPFELLVKLDFNKNLTSWNKKEYSFFIITTLILIVSIITALIFFFLYNKKTEEQIKLHKLQLQDQEKFKFLFQDAHFFSAVLDNNGKIIELNTKALEFLGKTNFELKGEYFWNLKCWEIEDMQKFKFFLQNIYKKKIEIEVTASNKYNQKRVIEFTFSTFKIDEKKAIVAIGLDVTERKEREKQLKQAFTVFNNTRDGIMITDKTTKIIDVNKAFEKITGYKKIEVLGEKTNILRSNLHKKSFYETIWENIQKNGYWEGEIISFKKNKKEFTQWLTINAIYDKKGEVANYIGVFSDITEQKIKEKLLKEKDNVLYQQSKMAAMGEMIGNIAHQWRQPLSIISTAATGIIVQKSIGVLDNENEIKVLNDINTSCQYLSKTIDDFRNFLKADKELKKFNLSKAIEEGLSLSSVKMKKEEIKVFFELNTIEVYGIKNEFIQVIINILNNAKDALLASSEKNKYIFIEILQEGNFVYIKIKDNAGGVSEDILERIFEPYFTTKHKSQGAGIGLYMCEEIIKNHMKGVLYVKNELYSYENKTYKGACFIIELAIEKD